MGLVIKYFRTLRPSGLSYARVWCFAEGRGSVLMCRGLGFFFFPVGVARRARGGWGGGVEFRLGRLDV